MGLVYDLYYNNFTVPCSQEIQYHLGLENCCTYNLMKTSKVWRSHLVCSIWLHSVYGTRTDKELGYTVCKWH